MSHRLDERFGAGLTELQVRHFQTILHRQCGVDLGLPEAWARAIELLSLVERLLLAEEVTLQESAESTEFAYPRS